MGRPLLLAAGFHTLAAAAMGLATPICTAGLGDSSVDSAHPGGQQPECPSSLVLGPSVLTIRARAELWACDCPRVRTRPTEHSRSSHGHAQAGCFYPVVLRVLYAFGGGLQRWCWERAPVPSRALYPAQGLSQRFRE